MIKRISKIKDKIILLIFSVALISIGACRQDSYTLKYNWDVGKEIKYQVLVTQKFLNDSDKSSSLFSEGIKSKMLITVKVISVNDKSNINIQSKIDEYTLLLAGMDLNKSMDKSKLPLFTAVYDSYGKLIHKGPVKHIYPGVDPTIGLGGFPSLLINLPDHPVKVGDQWTIEKKLEGPGSMTTTKKTFTVTRRYKLLGVEKHSNIECFKIELKFALPLNFTEPMKTGNGSFETKGMSESTGCYWLDKQSLELIDCDAAVITNVKSNVPPIGKHKEIKSDTSFKTIVKIEKVNAAASH